jgi:hypothetical protein
MKGWILALLIALGLILVLAATGSGRDNTGKMVRAQTWTNDACGTIGAWAGAMKSIRQELQKDNYGARRGDGGSGDLVEGAVTLRIAVDRAFIATRQTLKSGLKRAGIPDSPGGARAAAALRAWAARTEANLLAARSVLKHKPPSSSYASQAFQEVVTPVAALACSVADGLLTLRTISAFDPALADLFNGSSNCRRLSRKTA